MNSCYKAVVNVDEMIARTLSSIDGEVPTKVIRVHRPHVRRDMLDIF